MSNVSLSSSAFRIESALTIISKQLTSNNITHPSSAHEMQGATNRCSSMEVANIGTPNMNGVSSTQPTPTQAPWRVQKSPTGALGHILNDFEPGSTVPESSDSGLGTTDVPARPLLNPYIHQLGPASAFQRLPIFRPEMYSAWDQLVPVSAFERLPTFRPEMYSAWDNSTSLFSVYACEISATDYTRTHQCAIFYSQAPREWTRLMVTMTASIQSEYWSLGRVKTAPPGVTYCLPSRLTLAMEAFLKSHPHVKQDAHLSIFLGHGLEQGRASSISLKFSKPLFPVNAYMREITSMLYHMNCPRYPESKLVRRPLYKYRPDYLFITFVDSRWVLEIRFGSHKSQIDS